MTAPPFFILTGGPGSGKTTLTDALAERGLRVAPESARAIIQDQVAIGGRGLPWADRALYIELMLAADLRAYREALAAAAPVIFDRGLPELIGYAQFCELPVPDHLRQAVSRHPYRSPVIFAPPWPAIYRQDAERKQSLDEAVRTADRLRATYRDLGYTLVDLPLASVADRVGFVLATLATALPKLILTAAS